MAKVKVEATAGDGVVVVDPVPPTMEQLQKDADEAKAQATQAAKDSQRLQFIAESLSAEAESKVAEANRVAADAETQRAQMEAQLAAAVAETEKAKAALAEAQAKAAADTAAVARDTAETAMRLAERLSEGTKPKGGPSVRLEGGGFVLVDGLTGPRDYRVLGMDGCYYEHVGTHASGEWTYRNQDA